MRYIEKNNPCQAFDNYIHQNLKAYLQEYLEDSTNKTHPWDKLRERKARKIKNTLIEHLYWEQKGLCIYCQQALNPNNEKLSEYAHGEHLKPKGTYPQYTYQYKNLVVSCNGFDTTTTSNRQEFCGHKKDGEYEEDLFLDPTEVMDIEKYFSYTVEGKIQPSKHLEAAERIKAEYMIRLLDLRHQDLIRMRAESYSALIERSVEEQQELLNADVDLLPGFYSMLQQLT